MAATGLADERTAEPETIAAIPPPEGYERVAAAQGSFGECLRTIALKEDRHVYLYNGELKRNQSAQFAVLDIPVGKKDLQQCADAVMRLRAEYLFSRKKYSEIAFRDNNNKWYKWTGGDNRAGFEKYLENVFGWCGTASLEKQLRAVTGLQQMQPGDVFIRGGFPGHAMIVVDMAMNKEGEKVFMLAQSYMPAQDIHVVNNDGDSRLSPWYQMQEGEEIDTPEWVFAPSQLRTW
ncbi:MAG: DUF4846 domain-containing protein [Chitinophagaceae bacterium]